MARFTQTSHATASKRSVLVATWMFAAAIAAVFNTENFVGFRQAQTNPRGITVHATSGDGVVAIPIGDARPRKLKTRDELVYDTLGGIAAGGATAMMLIASAATTISMLKQATPAVPATAGRSVIVPLTTPAVVSITPPAQIVAAPAQIVAAPLAQVVAPPAMNVGASRMPRVAAAPAPKAAASRRVTTASVRRSATVASPAVHLSSARVLPRRSPVVVRPGVVTPMAVATAVGVASPMAAAPPVISTPVAAPLVEAAVQIESQVAPKTKSQFSPGLGARELSSIYGYSKTKSAYFSSK